MKKNKIIKKYNYREERLDLECLLSFISKEDIEKLINLEKINKNNKHQTPWKISTYDEIDRDYNGYPELIVTLSREESDEEFEKRKQKILEQEQVQKERDLKLYNELKKKLKIK